MVHYQADLRGRVRHTSAQWDRTGAPCPPFGGWVSPARPPNRTCGFHRIRHYGLLASAARKANIARIRNLLGADRPERKTQATAEIIPLSLREPCPCCGGPMRIIEMFGPGQPPRSRAPPSERAA